MDVPKAVEDLDRPAPVFEIDANETLSRPLTVSIPVDDVGEDDAVVVLTAETVDGPWTALEADVEDGYARFVTPHLSLFSAVRVSLDWLKDRVEDLFNGFTSEVFRDTDQPECDDEDGARSDGWTIASAGPDTLKWCFGRDDEGRFVTVANNRRYPVALSVAGPLELDDQVDPLLAESLAEVIERAFGVGGEVLVARETVTYRVGELADGDSARLRTEYDGFAQALGTIQYAIEAFLSIITRFGFSSTKSAADVLADVVAAPACADALAAPDLSDRIVGAVGDCLDGADFGRLFGATAGVVASLVVAVGGFVAFLAQSAQAAWDLVTGGDLYSVTVGRTVQLELPHSCGSVASRTGNDIEVVIAQPGVACDEALAVVERYANDDGLTYEGSSGFATFDGWSCWSDTIPQANGATGGCGREGADGSDAIEMHPGVPAAVSDTVSRILAAAQAEDLDALAAIAGPAFTSTFGDPGGSPKEFWEAELARGVDVFGTLVDLLSGRGAMRDGIWVWPGEVVTDPCAEYGDDDCYYGFVVNVADDGTWTAFVEGD